MFRLLAGEGYGWLTPETYWTFWMWNPKNYNDYFKDRITFEDYPRDQFEVDDIITRNRIPVRRIIYDPE